MNQPEPPHPFSLRGRTVFVTGGTQGVGAAICRAIAQAQGDLVIHGLRDDERARETIAFCQNAGVRVETLFEDLLEQPTHLPLLDRSEKLFASALALNPAIDSLVNNAGIYLDRSFLELDEATYYHTMQLNVAAGLFLTRAAARHWVAQQCQGRVVFTGSINGLLSEPNHVTYNTSKGAVAAMTRSLCVELAPLGIRVNSMAPGLVRTPLTDALNTDRKLEQWMESHTPNHQVPEADVCGPPVVFLLSNAAEHIHGQTLYVDGGMSTWQQPDAP